MITTLAKSKNDVDAATIATEAGALLRAGELVVIPTDTVYGVAASAASEAGVAKLRALMGITEDAPLTVHLASRSEAGRYADLRKPLVARFVSRVFPGPITLIMPTGQEWVEAQVQSGSLSRAVAQQIYWRGTVGLRCLTHRLARQILEAAGEPVVACSVSDAMGRPALDAETAGATVEGGQVAMVVDGGRTRYGRPSTVVRMLATQTGLPAVRLERAGVYDERTVRKLMRWNMLLVCSGNTCRSPMAEGIARKLMADKLGLAADDLEAAGLRVTSAGTSAGAGMPASVEAVEVMHSWDVPLQAHRSQRLTEELINDADVIYCMTRSHYQAVLDMKPNLGEKLKLLDESRDVSDPIGGSRQVYLRCAEQIRGALIHRLSDLEL